jgi:hypothetical protein
VDSELAASGNSASTLRHASGVRGASLGRTAFESVMMDLLVVMEE